MNICKTRVTILNNEDDLPSIRDAWNRLAELTDKYSVYLRSEWFDAAWQWRKETHKLSILAVWRDDKLIGICPLMSSVSTRYFMKTHELAFLTVPDTQNCNILADPAEIDEVMSALVDFLLGGSIQWDYLELEKLEQDTQGLHRLPALLQNHKLATQIVSDGNNPGFSLKGTWEEYYARRSRRLKKGNNYIANQLKKSGKTVATHQTNSNTSHTAATESLSAAINLSSRSWKTKTGLTLENPGPSAFIRRLTDHAHQQGWLSIWLLYLDGAPAAMEYQLTYNGIVSALRADYDSSLDDLSPGTYLNWKLTEQLFSAELQRYDMGPGDIAYKRRWAEQFQDLYRIKVYNRTLRGTALGITENTLRPALKQLIGSIRSLVPKDPPPKK